MNTVVEQLLEPVSADRPCGPDLADDLRLGELEELLKGKPEVEMGSVFRPAEPPDWREVGARSEVLLRHSKHLRVAVVLCCSWLCSAGLAGLRDGLELIRGLLERYWPTLYPLLDSEENDSPTWRLNVLSGLTSDRGTLLPATQQWLAVVDYLYTTPLGQPKGAEPITLERVVAARKRTEPRAAGPATEGAPAPPAVVDSAQLDQAFRAVPPTELEANRAAVSAAFEALEGMDRFLTETLGASNTISFDPLRQVLREITSILMSYSPGGATAAAAPARAPTATRTDLAPAPSLAGVPGGGPIHDPEDVVRAIEAICEYYHRAEPCSPVPYLLRRAQKLARMNFVEAVQELSLATVDSLRPSMGSALDAEPPSGATPAA